MFNNIIKNACYDIPRETTICDDRDPPWINKDVKQVILNKKSWVQILHSQW